MNEIRTEIEGDQRERIVAELARLGYPLAMGFWPAVGYEADSRIVRHVRSLKSEHYQAGVAAC
jgi:hypothetical protein